MFSNSFIATSCNRCRRCAHLNAAAYCLCCSRDGAGPSHQSEIGMGKRLGAGLGLQIGEARVRDIQIRAESLDVIVVDTCVMHCGKLYTLVHGAQ